MNFKALTILLFYFSIGISAQCDLLVNEVDEFTKKKEKISKEVKFHGKMGSNSFISFKSVDETNYIQFKYQYSLDEAMLVTMENTFYLMLDDDSVLELPPNQSSISKHELIPGTSTMMRYIIVFLKLNEEQTESVLNKQVKKARLTTTESNFDLEVKPKFKPKIQKAAKCVFQ